ncbi:tyrosine-type recombinase/integrase [Janthinobacterium sp. NKUCC06_STL]|nr:tyrosine-type recombinase/integrase [Janthinobacterium sp. NKUCC06_STL]
MRLWLGLCLSGGPDPATRAWASWHVQNGTPLNVLQELGGWESTQMVRRYAHFSASHLAVYAERLPNFVK